MATTQTQKSTNKNANLKPSGKTNKMQTQVELDKVVINIGAGGDISKIERGQNMLKKLVGGKSIITKATGAAKTFQVKSGAPMGVKITLRKQKALAFLKLFFTAFENIKASSFDKQGNISCGTSEYFRMKDIKYDPSIGTLGLECMISLKKPGKRVKLKKRAQSKVGKKQRVEKEEAIAFIQKEFGIKVKE